MLGILTKKIGMTQVFDEEGNSVPVTVLELLENVITFKKSTKGKDKYNAFQVGVVEEKKESRLTKAEAGHLKKRNLKVFKVLKEFRVTEEILDAYEIGVSLDPLEVLGQTGSLIDATGRPIGKGTSGRIKRWNQHRRTMTHGTKHHRQMGSAGAGTTPGRVFKGKKMPGRDDDQTTISHLVFFKYDPENKIVLIKGAVPGHRNAIVVLKPSKPKTGWNCHFFKEKRRKIA